MRTARLAAAAAVAAMLIAPVAATAAQKETETVDRTLQASPGGTLKLKNFSGKVTITGTPRDQVVIHAVRRATRENLDRIQLQIDQAGGTITVDANKRDDGWRKKNDNVVETDFTIEVPMRFDLEVSVFSSPVEVTGVEGDHEIDGFSSTMDIRDSGPRIKAKTFSGNIEIEATRLASTPELDVDTFSGDIRVALPASASGQIDFDSFSGSIDSELPMTISGRSRRNKLRAQLGGGGGTRLQFNTFSGDVELRRQ